MLFSDDFFMWSCDLLACLYRFSLIRLEEGSSLTSCWSQSSICRFFYTQVGFMYRLIMDLLTNGCLNVPITSARHLFTVQLHQWNIILCVLQVSQSLFFSPEIKCLTQETRWRWSAAWVQSSTWAATPCSGTDKPTTELRWSSSSESTVKLTGTSSPLSKQRKTASLL